MNDRDAFEFALALIGCEIEDYTSNNLNPLVDPYLGKLYSAEKIFEALWENSNQVHQK